MRREGSRNSYLTQRIPADVRPKVVGMRLAIPVGDGSTFITLTDASQAVRCSLRASALARLRRVREPLRASWSRSGRLFAKTLQLRFPNGRRWLFCRGAYRVWADEEDRSRSIAMQFTPGVGWQRADESHDEIEAQWQAIVAMWEQVGERDSPNELERKLGPLS